MPKYFNTLHTDINIESVESILGYPEDSLQEISWEVAVTVSGKYLPSTMTDPEEYPEIEWEIISASVHDIHDTWTMLTPDQMLLVEHLSPQDEETYWDIAERSREYKSKKSL